MNTKVVTILSLILLVSIIGIASYDNLTKQNEKYKPESVTDSSTVPFGTAEINLDFVVDHQQTTSLGPTNFLGTEIGKTVVYDLNIKNFPLKDILAEYVDSNFSQILDQFDFNHSQVFFKVQNENNDIIDLLFGFKFGNDIVLNFTTILDQNDVPAFLQSFLIPKDFTIWGPSNVNTAKKPGSNIFDQCSCEGSEFGIYLDPSDWTGQSSKISSLITNMTINQNMTILKNKEYSKATLPSNAVYKQFMYDDAIIENVTGLKDFPIAGITMFNTSIPYSNIYGVFNASEFNNTAGINPYDYTSNNVDIGVYNTQNDHLFFPHYKDRLFVTDPVYENETLTIVYRPDTTIYANQSQITLPGVNISDVHGVFLNYDVDYKSFTEIPAGTTNYYTGGSFSGDTITLGTQPDKFDKLTVYYTEQTRISQAPTFMHEYIPNQNFKINISASQTNDPVGELYAEMNWDLANNPNSGWMNDFYFNLGIDLDNSSVIDLDENVELSLILNETASYQTPNPLSVGDQGVYTVKNSNLDVALGGGWDSYFDSLFVDDPNFITNLESNFSTMMGRNIFNYTVTGIDGLYYSLNGTVWDPLNSSNPIVESGSFGNSVFSSFTGSSFANKTENSQQFAYSLYDFYGSKDLLNYYRTFYPLANGTYSYDDNGNVFATENVTISEDNTITLGAPAEFSEVDIIFANEFDFSKNPIDQNITYWYYYFNRGETNNSNVLYDMYLNSSIPISIGSEIIVYYYPDKQINAKDGVVYLPTTVDQVHKIFYSDGLATPFNSSINLFDNGTFTGSTITLGADAPLGMYGVSVEYSSSPLGGSHVYSSTGVLPYATTTLINSITPARTTDFEFTKNTAKSLDALSKDKIEPAVTWLKQQISDNPDFSQYFYAEDLFDLNLDFNTTFTDAGTNKTFEIATALSGFIPVKYDGGFFTYNTRIQFLGGFKYWSTWSSEGILKEVGISFNLAITTAQETGTTITLDSPQDFTIYTTDPKIVTWTPKIDVGSGLNYSIYLNDVSKVNGTFVNNQPITFNVGAENLAVGNYSLLIVIEAYYNKQVYNTSDIVNFEVIEERMLNIFLNHPSDISFTEGEQFQTVSWFVGYNYGFAFYNYYVDGEFLESDTISNNSYVTQGVSDLSPGIHEVEIEIFLSDGIRNVNKTDTVLVIITVDEQINPGTTNIPIEGTFNGYSSNATVTISTNGAASVSIAVADKAPSETEAALQAQANEFTPTGYYIEININDSSLLEDVWINVSYAEWDLEALGFVEDNLKIYYYNENSAKWLPAGETGVDKENKILYAHVDHLTAFAAVAIPDDVTTSSSEPIVSSSSTSSSSNSKPPISTSVPGFEILIIIISFLGISTLKRTKNK